ncbi:MAG: serine/threonine-protein kinase [Polyangia bacterium]
MRVAAKTRTNRDDAYSETLTPGTRVGEYVIERHIANGGMSSVYSAVHPIIGKRAAIKVISQNLSRDAAAVESFLEEARAVNRIRHASIVDIFSFGSLPDGRSYLAMEHLEGETLADRIWSGRMSAGECFDILLQICEALEAAHAKRIAHLDLKPENVYLVPLRNGGTRVKLLDFGIAKLLRSDVELAADAEPAAFFSGTPQYASPEQAQALPTVNERSDCYSLGVMAFELFVGHCPFQSNDVATLLMKHVDQEPPVPSSLAGHITPALDRLILSLLEKDARLRPTMAKVRSMVADLRLLTMGPTQQCRPVARARKSSRPRLLHAAVAALVVSFGLAVMHRLPMGHRAAAIERAPVAIEPPAPNTPVVALAPPAPPAPPRVVTHHSRHSKAVAVVATRATDDYVLDYLGRPQ